MTSVPKTTDKTKLKLKILDRVAIKRLFPQEANLVSQVLAKDIDAKVSVSQKELDAFDMRLEEGRMTWNADKDNGKFIEFTNAEIEFLKKQIDEIDRKNKITVDMVGVCLKIRDIKSEK